MHMQYPKLHLNKSDGIFQSNQNEVANTGFCSVMHKEGLLSYPFNPILGHNKIILLLWSRHYFLHRSTITVNFYKQNNLETVTWKGLRLIKWQPKTKNVALKLSLKNVFFFIRWKGSVFKFRFETCITPPPAPFPSQPNVSKWIQEGQSCVEQNLHFVFLAKLWQSTLEINTQTNKKQS